MSFINDDRNRHLMAGALGVGALGLEPKNTLASLLNRPEVKNLFYNHKKLVLDGYTFIGCRFDNCILEISSTNFDLISCIIDSTTTITYSPSVLKIIKLFNSRHPWAYQQIPEFAPIQNADGTITISDRKV